MKILNFLTAASLAVSTLYFARKLKADIQNPSAGTDGNQKPSIDTKPKNNVQTPGTPVTANPGKTPTPATPNPKDPWELLGFTGEVADALRAWQARLQQELGRLLSPQQVLDILKSRGFDVSRIGGRTSNLDPNMK